MAENSENETRTDLNNELMKQIYHSNCAIKYPNNILSCLISLNFYDHLKICPHFCPTGKIIKICLAPSGVSSIWVSISTQFLPVTGEALYILKRKTEVLKNDFPLIGFMGKIFPSLGNSIYKIDNLCILKDSQELRIGVIIYFKHWEKCSIPLVEIPQQGIPIPNLTKDKKNPKIQKRNPSSQFSYEGKLKKASNFFENLGSQLGAQKVPKFFPEKPRTSDSQQNTHKPIFLENEDFSGSSERFSDSGSDMGASSGSVNFWSSDYSTSVTWGSKSDPCWEKVAYENLAFQMDAQKENCNNCESFKNQNGTQMGSEEGSGLGSQVEFCKNSGVEYNSNFEGKQRYSQEGTQVGSKRGSQMGSEGSRLGSELKFCENCQDGFSLHFKAKKSNSTQMGSEEGSRLGAELNFCKNCQDSSSLNFKAEKSFFTKGTQMGTEEGSSFTGAQYDSPVWLISKSNQTKMSRISYSEIELSYCEDIYENPDKKFRKFPDDFFTQVFTFLLSNFDIFTFIFVCLFLYLLFYILIHYHVTTLEGF